MLERINSAVWGMPTAALILGAGALFTLILGFPQIRRFFGMIRSAGGSDGEKNTLSAFESLSTSLAATVGTGSVTGVATAITLGGAGAVFWLWVSAFFGMAVAYAEGALSIKYRKISPDGSRSGGIWRVLEDGLNAPKLAKIYAVLCVLASFGMGCMAQTNSAALALNKEFGLKKTVFGAACAAILGLCMFFGTKFAGKLCKYALLPLAGLYILGAAAIIIVNRDALPGVFKEITDSAFGLRPAAGGLFGAATAKAVSVGLRRGIFSNEAGLGTTAPVHAASAVDDPDRQGLMNMLEVFIDTFVICTLTALAILCSGAVKSGADGSELIIESAKAVFGGLSGGIVAVSTAGFAVATAIGWSQIGLFAADYVFGQKTFLYRCFFAASALFGALLSASSVWQISDIFNGLMALPCLTALLLKAGEVKAICPSTRIRSHRVRSEEALLPRKPRGI